MGFGSRSRTGTGGELLWMRKWTFGFHKMRGISWLAEELLHFQEGVFSMELAIMYCISLRRGQCREINMAQGRMRKGYMVLIASVMERFWVYPTWREVVCWRGTRTQPVGKSWHAINVSSTTQIRANNPDILQMTRRELECGSITFWTHMLAPVRFMCNRKHSAVFASQLNSVDFAKKSPLVVQ